MRTQEEIFEKFEEFKKSGRLFAPSDLTVYLDYEHVLPLLKEGITKEDWDEDAKQLVDSELKTEAIDYLPFAIGKATEHRGISAGRSVEHYEAWLWLLDMDALVDWSAYSPYGVPILKKVAYALGATELWDEAVKANPRLGNMADGKPCDSECREGCQ